MRRRQLDIDEDEERAVISMAHWAWYYDVDHGGLAHLHDPAACYQCAHPEMHLRWPP